MSGKMIIRIPVNKVAIGHRQHVAGGGVHHDKRLKRQKTRAGQRRAALREWS